MEGRHKIRIQFPDLIETQNLFILLLLETHIQFLSTIRLDEDAKTDDQECQKWCNGWGTFHKSVHSTGQIEIGALVHAECVVGGNVCIGSGTVVGPAATIGQSTKTGLCSVTAQLVIPALSIMGSALTGAVGGIQ